MKDIDCLFFVALSYVSSSKEGLEKVATSVNHVVLLESTMAEYNVMRDCR